MSLFSKVTSNTIMTTSIIFTKGKGFKFMECHAPPTASKIKSPAILICMYRYPNGDYGVPILRELFQDQFDSDTGYYKLTADDVWELYTNWRRAYASGYDHSEIFNAYGIRLPNPFINSESTPTFDIRLGHVITCDITARRLIGSGSSPFPSGVS